MLNEQTTLKLKFPLFLLHLCYFSPANMSRSLCGRRSISNSSGVENIVRFFCCQLPWWIVILGLHYCWPFFGCGARAELGWVDGTNVQLFWNGKTQSVPSRGKSFQRWVLSMLNSFLKRAPVWFSSEAKHIHPLTKPKLSQSVPCTSVQDLKRPWQNAHFWRAWMKNGLRQQFMAETYLGY